MNVNERESNNKKEDDFLTIHTRPFIIYNFFYIGVTYYN